MLTDRQRGLIDSAVALYKRAHPRLHHFHEAAEDTSTGRITIAGICYEISMVMDVTEHYPGKMTIQTDNFSLTIFFEYALTDEEHRGKIYWLNVGSSDIDDGMDWYLEVCEVEEIIKTTREQMEEDLVMGSMV